MKKFARCILILILVAILSGVGGYIYENNTMTPMYESVAKLYVVPLLSISKLSVAKSSSTVALSPLYLPSTYVNSIL